MGRASRAKAAFRDAGGISIRRARPGDGRPMLQVLEAIDQEPTERMQMSAVADVVDLAIPQPAHLGVALRYVAVNRTGQIVGALVADTPLDWTASFNPDVAAALRRRLVEFSALAVVPDFRRRGVGKRLLETAEVEYSRRGYGLAEVTYRRDAEATLGGFYRAAGFTELDPGEPLRVLHDRTLLTMPYRATLRVAIKSLGRDVTITTPPDGFLAGMPRIVRGLINVPA